jgi:hypothetical protein
MDFKETDFEQDKDLVEMSKVDMVYVARSCEIRDSSTQAGALNIRETAKDAIKKIEDKRKVYTVPLNKILDAINASARKIAQPFKDALDIIDQKLKVYQNELLEAKKKE